MPAEDGLPASVQLVGRHGDDALVLARGHAFYTPFEGEPAADGRPTTSLTMRSACLTVLCALGLALPAVAQARVDAGPPAAPKGLKAFLLRAEEPTRHEFSRTPSFAWRPVAGALRYEFELATSRRFSGSSIVWTNVGDELAEPAATTAPASAPATPGTATTGGETTAPATPKLTDSLRAPTIAIDLALPWITGSPYALYAHVRAITKAGPTPWGKPFGFNVRWSSIPRDLDSPYPGLVRWSPVEGATSYQVWLHGAKWTFETTTNVADARELYTFHATPRVDELDLVPGAREAHRLRRGRERPAYDVVRPVEPALHRRPAAALARDAGQRRHRRRHGQHDR